jgi:tRNA(Ile)-lysidine synthase
LKDLAVPRRGERVVCGLSGGADSVALLDALCSLQSRHGFSLVAAHLDHGLRAGSADDAGWCAALAARLGLPFRTAVADVRGRARREKKGLEHAARTERYAFLERVRAAEGAAAVAVAHTLDDQAETVLLHLLRGAGPAGLAGMRPRRGALLRPLLGLERRDVLAYLARRGLDWREDPTNRDAAFVRNRIRHELLPYLEARFNPQVRRALARTAALLGDEQERLTVADATDEGAVRSDGAHRWVARRALSARSRPEARRLLRRALAEVGGLAGVGAVHVERVLGLALDPAGSGKRVPLPGGREAVVVFEEVRLGPRLPAAEAFDRPLPVPGRVALPGGWMLEARPVSAPAASNTEGGSAVAAPEEAPLRVRTRRPGDRVAWHGRDVSLKRFLSECRIPADVRSGLPLVAAGGRILWVAGRSLEGGGGGRWVDLRLVPPGGKA